MLRVKNICKQRGITLKELATRMNISPETLSRMLSENGNPTLSSLENIAKALNVEVFELFDKFSDGLVINGFVEVNKEISRISNFNDLEIIYNALKHQ